MSLGASRPARPESPSLCPPSWRPSNSLPRLLHTRSFSPQNVLLVRKTFYPANTRSAAVAPPPPHAPGGVALRDGSLPQDLPRRRYGTCPPPSRRERLPPSTDTPLCPGAWHGGPAHPFTRRDESAGAGGWGVNNSLTNIQVKSTRPVKFVSPSFPARGASGSRGGGFAPGAPRLSRRLRRLSTQSEPAPARAAQCELPGSLWVARLPGPGFPARGQPPEQPRDSGSADFPPRGRSAGAATSHAGEPGQGAARADREGRPGRRRKGTE